MKLSIAEWIRGYEKAGLLRGVDACLESLRVEVDEAASGRLNFEIPEMVVDICAVTAGNLIRY